MAGNTLGPIGQLIRQQPQKPSPSLSPQKRWWQGVKGRGQNIALGLSLLTNLATIIGIFLLFYQNMILQAQNEQAQRVFNIQQEENQQAVFKTFMDDIETLHLSQTSGDADVIGN